MKKLSFVAVIALLFMQAAQAQKIRTGIYAGAGFSTVKSDYDEIGVLPISKGGLNLHFGIHVNIPVTNRFELETGLQKVTRGYKYTDNSPLGSTEYTKIQCVSVPVMAVYHILDYPEEVPFRFSVGLGVYGSYAVSGRIEYEDGTHDKATFGNARRNEFGPRWMMKWEFAHKFECYLSNDMKSTNIIKNGSGSLKQGSFQVGFGYVL